MNINKMNVVYTNGVMSFCIERGLYYYFCGHFFFARYLNLKKMTVPGCILLLKIREKLLSFAINVEAFWKF